MDVCILASSSSGNAVALRMGREVLLVDAGMSGKAIERRLDEIGWPPTELIGILLSHEHGDHSRGAGILSRRYNLPVYGTSGTLKALTRLWRGTERLEPISNGREFAVGGFTCEPFSIPHDVSDPSMFVVRRDGISVGFATDLGRPTALVVQKLANTDLAILEANHDSDELRWGDYPWSVKQRISSPHGHLSNEQAADLAMMLAERGVGHMVMGHLSPRHNDTDRVMLAVEKAFAAHPAPPRITVIPAGGGSGIISLTPRSHTATGTNGGPA